jgi:hypothetical protein
MSGLLLAVLSGCGADSARNMDHLSPRAVAVAMHLAIAAKDFDAVGKCVAPSSRGAMGSLLSAWKAYSVKALQTAALVEQRIDAAPARRLRAELDQSYADLLPSPLAGAARDGKIDWDRVQIQEQDNAAVVTVNGNVTPFGKRFKLVKVGGGWYVAPVEQAKAFAAWTRSASRSFDQLTKRLNRVQTGIKKGQIDQENIEKELWQG